MQSLELKKLGTMLIFLMACSLSPLFAQTPTHDDVNYEDMFSDVGNTAQHDVLSLLKKDENFSTFVEMIEKSGLDFESSLEQTGTDGLTIFAPTNEALEDVKDEQDVARIQTIVKAHMLPRKMYIADFQDNQVIQTAEGKEIEVGTVGDHMEIGQPDQVIIGGARIVKSDIEASNGVIHVMNDIINKEETVDVGFGR